MGRWSYPKPDRKGVLGKIWEIKDSNGNHLKMMSPVRIIQWWPLSIIMNGPDFPELMSFLYFFFVQKQISPRIEAKSTKKNLLFLV